ncbi:hypothetical protein ACIF6K_28920 [Streptomyces sp. NPDC085942]
MPKPQPRDPTHPLPRTLTDLYEHLPAVVDGISSRVALPACRLVHLR